MSATITRFPGSATPVEDIPSLVPTQGWNVLHLFYQVDLASWEMLGEEEQSAARVRFLNQIQQIRQHPQTQLILFSVIGHKADFGVMILTPDLGDLDVFAKLLTRSLGHDILDPVYSYYSLTEWTEYFTTEEEYAAELVNEGFPVGTEEHELKLVDYRSRMKKYYQDRLYPNMPGMDWPFFCFYPMSKRRSGEDNWYSLNFEARRNLMQGHARVGRKWAGKVRQLITGSTGIDSMEWGVTLFSKNQAFLKEIVYEMRFDEVSARYGEFGDFFIGLHIEPSTLLGRLGLIGSDEE